MRRSLRHLTLLLAVVALVIGATPAAAADGSPSGRVTIVSAAGATGPPLVLTDLATALDVHDARYLLRAADGGSTAVSVAAGITLGSLLREAGADLDGFTYAEIPRADGTSILVLHDQAVAIADAPVVWEDGEGVHLLRPGVGAGDVNADDLVTPPDGALTVRLRTGDPLGVRIDATPLRARPRSPVSFSAVLVAGERPGVAFAWYFDDGEAGADGAHVTHAFRRAGTYQVLVNVSERGRQLDVYDVVTVVVAAPRRQRHSRHDASGALAGGSNRGTADHTSSPPRRASDKPALPRRAARATQPRTPRKAMSEPVTGTLLASAGNSPLASLASRHASARVTAAKRPLHIPMVAWVAAGVAALVAAGWMLETRHTRPFWRD